MTPSGVLPAILLLIGAGFLIANLWLLVQFMKYVRRRSTAVLTWPARRPANAWVFGVMGLALALIIVVKLLVKLPPSQVFGESMMLVYFGCAARLSWRIGRGFYKDGIWADTGFVRYSDIGGLSWREGEEVTLLLISRVRNLARRLVVPQACYGAARRLLRDRIAVHEIQFSGEHLDLGGRDEREDV